MQFFQTFEETYIWAILANPHINLYKLKKEWAEDNIEPQKDDRCTSSTQNSAQVEILLLCMIIDMWQKHSVNYKKAQIQYLTLHAC